MHSELYASEPNATPHTEGTLKISIMRMQNITIPAKITSPCSMALLGALDTPSASVRLVEGRVRSERRPDPTILLMQGNNNSL